MKKENSKNTATQPLIGFIAASENKMQNEKTTFAEDDYNIDELLRELQLYQVALEKQNDELRVSQDALEKERIRFSNLFNLAPVGYFILDRGLIINECNDAAFDLLDSGRTNVIGKKILKFISPDNYDVLYSFIGNLIYVQKRLTCELKFCTANGRDFHGLVEGNVIHNSNENELSYYLAIIDITEKRVAELEQRDIRERLEMALKASSTGTLTIQVKTMEVKLDNYAFQILRLRKEDFNGRFESLIKLVYEKNRKRVKNVIHSAIEDGAELNLETQVLINNEIRDVEIRGHFTGEEPDKYFAGVITDITERKKLEEEAEKLKAAHHEDILNAVIKAQENERMRISGALHDSVGQLLYATTLSLDNSGIEHKDVKNAVRLLNEAIRETRNISFELAPPVLSDYGLEVAIKEMIKRVSVSPVKIQLTISGFNERLEPSCELFIFRMVQELLNNVVRHSKASEAAVEVIRKADMVLVKIKDNGKGIQLDKSASMGTGLSSIRNRIELYKGKFEIKAEKNKGTEVVIKVPHISKSKL
ncbi:MAG: PAS domain-containing sensor histidine kinase [Bacteroidia bacterium]